MSLNVKIEYESEVDELIREFKTLNFLKDFNVQENSNISWQRGSSISFDLQVIFIGKTGYGKSSTLNSIIGKDIFITNDIKSCTKKLYSAEYRISERKPYYFSLCDLPGVGESDEADKQYMNWYRDILVKSNCVVYVLRADQRDYSIDEMIFNDLFKDASEKKKVLIALNYADKVEPLNKKYPFSPSEMQLRNLNSKIDSISVLFNIHKDNIVYYSAMEKYNIDSLVTRISYIVRKANKFSNV